MAGKRGRSSRYGGRSGQRKRNEERKKKAKMLKRQKACLKNINKVWQKKVDAVLGTEGEGDKNKERKNDRKEKQNQR